MIIRHPTGLYQNNGQLPIRPSDSGSITFTISSEDPKRAVADILRLPIGQELRVRSGLIFSDDERRVNFGEFLFTISTGRQSDGGSNKKLFEVGEFLTFTDDQIREITTTEVPDVVDIQHNTNILDLNDVGLTDDEEKEILKLANDKSEEFQAQIRNLQTEIKNLKTSIVENQKKINETRKVINGLTVLQENELRDRINDNLEKLLGERADLIDVINNKNTEIKDIFNKLIDISEFVR